MEEKEKIGYVPEKKVLELLQINDNKIIEQNEKFSDEEENLKLKEFEKINNLETLKKISNLKSNHIICERCYKLKNYLKFENLDKKMSDSKEIEKIENYTQIAKKLNVERLIQQIMVRISSKSHVFYLCVKIYK